VSCCGAGFGDCSSNQVGLGNIAVIYASALELLCNGMRYTNTRFTYLPVVFHPVATN